MNFKIFTFSQVANALGSTILSYNTSAPSYSTPALSYNDIYVQAFNAVRNDYNHQQNRNGYTQGAYYVLLPDGRLQRVSYTVNGYSGYVAEVTYEGEAHYPTYQLASSRSYQPAPAPSYQPGSSLSYQPAPTPSYPTIPSYE
ncbi:uncharacterized protein LOC119587113 [Penaeus monodon]|uniref:uncharacterized protein LOC119587113 n=1 Tax=Penaeus monodon TaxID=6687 RepID=UPI0018A77036|nr:uncharacterized protein LOC119587113 [Penaeus monodon]